MSSIRKPTLLKNLREAVAAGKINKNELLALFPSEDVKKSRKVEKDVTSSDGHGLNLSIIFYYIGGLIVLLGIMILVGNNWDFLNDAAKIILTLGTGLAAFGLGGVFHSSDNHQIERVGKAFFVLAAGLIPFGLGVTFDIAGWDVGSNGFISWVSALLIALYFVGYMSFKSELFLLLCVFFCTSFYFSFTSFLAQESEYLNSLQNFYEYKTLLAGVSYLLIGRYFVLTNHSKVLADFIYAVGTIAIMSTGLILGGFYPNEDYSLFWQVVYPLFCIAGIILSVFWTSRIVLTLSTIFMVGYIFKITGEHFADSLGWPLSLVIIGFLMIVIVFVSVNIFHKYFKKDLRKIKK